MDAEEIKEYLNQMTESDWDSYSDDDEYSNFSDDSDYEESEIDYNENDNENKNESNNENDSENYNKNDIKQDNDIEGLYHDIAKSEAAMKDEKAEEINVKIEEAYKETKTVNEKDLLKNKHPHPLISPGGSLQDSIKHAKEYENMYKTKANKKYQDLNKNKRLSCSKCQCHHTNGSTINPVTE